MDACIKVIRAAELVLDGSFAPRTPIVADPHQNPYFLKSILVSLLNSSNTPVLLSSRGRFHLSSFA